jgi:hypothetical protein
MTSRANRGHVGEGHRLRVFLCHASQDKEAVRDLYQRLQSDGFAAWLDEEDLPAGSTLEYEIRRAVRESDAVIVCLSQQAVSRRGFQQKEIRLALEVADEQPEGEIFVIPVKLEECKVPDRLSGLHWVSLADPKGYEKLHNSLNEVRASLNKRRSILSTPRGESPTAIPAAKPAGNSPPSDSNSILGRVVGVRQHRWRWRLVWVIVSLVAVVGGTLAASITLRHRGSADSPSTLGPSSSTQSTIPPAALGRATILSIKSADGQPGISGDLIVNVHVDAAPAAGRSLFLISNLHQAGAAVPHATYVAKASIPTRPGAYPLEARFHYSGSVSIGLVRTFMVVSADRAATVKLQDNLDHQSDPSWDIYRLVLPPGATTIATFPPVVRTRP